MSPSPDIQRYTSWNDQGIVAQYWAWEGSGVYAVLPSWLGLVFKELSETTQLGKDSNPSKKQNRMKKSSSASITKLHREKAEPKA
jgi:hypothetical protein